jgi:RNA polymerase sigma factor (sigma-70 family)
MDMESITLPGGLGIYDGNGEAEVEEGEEDRRFLERMSEAGSDDCPPSLTIYFQDLGRHGEILSRELEDELLKKVAAGDLKARKDLVRSNLRLVVKIARSYASDPKDLADLIRAGNIGLCYARDRFDPDKGFRFSTYSIWWARREMLRYLYNNTGLIKVPPSMLEEAKKIRDYTEDYLAQNGCMPSDEDIMERLSLKRERLILDRQCDYTYMSMYSSPSITGRVDEEDRNEFADLMVDDDLIEPGLSLFVRGRNRLLNELVGRLSEREQYIIKGFYGLDGQEERSLASMGRSLGLSKERVRKIRNAALEKLRDMGGERLEEFAIS